jgi:hypothetical protein
LTNTIPPISPGIRCPFAVVIVGKAAQKPTDFAIRGPFERHQ